MDENDVLMKITVGVTANVAINSTQTLVDNEK